MTNKVGAKIHNVLEAALKLLLFSIITCIGAYGLLPASDVQDTDNSQIFISGFHYLHLMDPIFVKRLLVINTLTEFYDFASY